MARVSTRRGTGRGLPRRDQSFQDVLKVSLLSPCSALLGAPWGLPQHNLNQGKGPWRVGGWRQGAARPQSWGHGSQAPFSQGGLAFPAWDARPLSPGQPLPRLPAFPGGLVPAKQR